MPDIAMCQGGDCPDKTRCYRFTATPTERRQTYFLHVPWKEGEKCEYFSPNEPSKLPPIKP